MRNCARPTAATTPPTLISPCAASRPPTNATRVRNNPFPASMMPWYQACALVARSACRLVSTWRRTAAGSAPMPLSTRTPDTRSRGDTGGWRGALLLGPAALLHRLAQQVHQVEQRRRAEQDQQAVLDVTQAQREPVVQPHAVDDLHWKPVTSVQRRCGIHLPMLVDPSWANEPAQARQPDKTTPTAHRPAMRGALAATV